MKINHMKIIEKEMKLNIQYIAQCKSIKNVYDVIATNDENGHDIECLIYDLSLKTSKFEYFDFISLTSKYPTKVLIFIFKDWNQERDEYHRVMNSATNAEMRKSINAIFKSKKSIYIKKTKYVKINVGEQGINFLEYPEVGNTKCLKEIEGKIFNVSFLELKKLFNVTGDDLFKDNVRFATDKDVYSLREKFKMYISFSVYNKVKSKKLDDDIMNKVEEYFDCFDELANDSLNYSSDLFWFCHNGITIYSYDKINFSSNEIKLNIGESSVINGAQTITKFFEVFDEYVRNELKDINDIISNKLVEVTGDEIIEEIHVKTIFINGNENRIRTITNGLNTQIPLGAEIILASSEEVESINKKLKNKLKITKEGEVDISTLCFTVLEFVKNWFTINNEPGKSKNLDKNTLEKTISDIDTIFQSEENVVEETIKAMKNLEYIYQWWNGSYKIRQKSIDTLADGNIICSYAKNYFGSYVTNYSKDIEFQLSDEALFQIFEEFVHNIKELRNEDLTVGDFKKDVLFKNMLIFGDKSKNSFTLDKLQEEQLIGQLNDPNQKQYSFNSTISKYFLENKMDFLPFRVISFVEGKKTPKEAFPFPNSTFNEICEISDGSYKKYAESLLYKEVNKEFNVIIVYKSDSKLNPNIVTKIRLIPSFSFKEYNEKAKCVYEKTITAFKMGDEKQFVKSSDDLAFHIRPKAVNAEDTFQFTNGEMITKRTFWANKGILSDIINNLAEN